MQKEENRFPDWHALYKEQNVETMPWYHPQLDSDLEKALDKRKINKGRFLDLGTGPATQALELAKRGFSVTGSDLSQSAIDRAKTLSKEIDFVQDDILNTKIRGNFDYIFDRGCFHVFDPSLRNTYVKKIASLIKPKGLLFLKCFSKEEEGDWGPYRLSKEEIENSFHCHFTLEEIYQTAFQSTLDHNPKALFCVLKQKGSLQKPF